MVTINGDRFYVPNAKLNANRDQPAVETTTGDGTPQPRGGTSAMKLVQLAGLSPAALQDVDDAMTVSLGNDSSRLSADEVRDGFDGDPRGHRVATFDGEYNANAVLFLRPRRPSESSVDEITGLSGQNLQVTLKTNGERLAVGLVPSATQIDPGETVTFHVDPRPAGSATYQWNLEGPDDPENGSEPTRSHMYAIKGHFEARVTVTTENGSSGTASVFIDVGKPKAGNTSDTPGSGSGLGGGGAAAGGGKAKSGGGDDARKGPSSGPAHAKKSDTTKKRAGSAAPGGSGGTGGGASRGVAARRGAAGSAGKRAAPATHGAGIPISGILLADQAAFKGALPALTGSPASALTSSAARAAAGSPGGLLAWVTGGALGIGVLLGGALREFRLLARRTLRSA